MRIHAPGTRIGQYEIISPPLMGDTSVTYFCHDHKRSCPVVLRGLRPEFLPAARDRFLRAGAAWVDLGAHPHIVRCHEVFQPENTTGAYLVLGLVFWEKEHDDASLRPWLTPGHPLPVLQALLFALQIARGMRYVTEKVPGFVHGDLKPENVLVGAGRLSQADVNRLRVTNLGLVTVLQEAGVETSEALNASDVSVEQTQLIHGIAGTPLYMALEQWRREGVSTATDIYALGGILYEMLVGRRAVAGKTVEALERAHCEANIRPLPYSLPEVVRALVIRCLALEPGERYESWEAMEIAIAAAYEEIVSYPVPAPEPTDALSQAERALVGWFYGLMGCSCNESGKADTALGCFQRALRYGHNEGDQGLIGAATSNLGAAYLALGDARRDLEHQEQALAIAREIGDRSLEGSALNYLGAAWLQLGSPNQAIEYLEQGLTIAREIGDRQGEAACVGNLGNVYRELGDLHRSADYLEQQLNIAREMGNRRGESVALSNLGVISIDLGDPRRAIEYEKQALEIRREIGDWYAQTTSLNNLASAYLALGDARQAVEYYERVLEMTREIGNRRGEAFALNNMGTSHSNLGNLQRALEYHEQALAIFREIGDRRGEGECLTNSGYVYMIQNDIQRAIETCEQALVIDREIGDMMGVALDSFNMANLLAQQARFAEALPYAEEAAGILEKVGHKTKAPEARDLVAAIRAELDTRTSKKEEKAAAEIPFDIRQQILRVRRDNPGLTANMTDEDIVTLLQQADRAWAKQQGEGVGPITVFAKRPGQPWEEQATIDRQDLGLSVEELLVRGQNLMNAGQWQEAEGTFSWMGSKAERANNTLYRSLASLFLGRIYTSRGKSSQAIESLDRALGLAEQIGDQRTVGVIYDAMGTLYETRGSYQEAIEYYTKAIEICKQLGDEQGVAVSQGNLGNVYLRQGDFEQAVEVGKEALEYFIRVGAAHAIAKAWCNLGRAYREQGRYDLSIEMLQKSQNAASRLGDELTAAQAYENLGVVYRELGNYPLAVTMYQEALAIYQCVGTELDVGRATAGLALVYQTADDVRQALAHYEMALEILEGTGSSRTQADIHLRLARLCRKIGQPTEAGEHYRKAQELYEALGDSRNAERASEESRSL